MKIRAMSLSLLFCATAGLASAEEGDTPGTESFSDPFSYCAAVKNADSPAAPYAGPAKPQVVLSGIRKAADIAADAPQEWVSKGTFWRCMDGEVYACFVGANLPCEEKANTNREPSDGLVAYCEMFPTSDNIPADVVSRGTVFDWNCRDGTPQIVKQVLQGDARGFLADYWYRLDRPE